MGHRSSFGWLQDKRTRFVAKTLPTVLGPIGIFASLVSQFGYLATVLIAFVGALFLWVAAGQVVEKASPQPTLGSAEKPTRQETFPKEAQHPVCAVGPYKIEAGENQSIFLDAKQGQKVRGHLAEVGKQLFDWYMADEKNMILLSNGDDFTSIDEGHDQNAYRVNRKIPYPARWYLILDMYGKKTSRKVRVDLEPIPPP